MIKFNYKLTSVIDSNIENTGCQKLNDVLRRCQKEIERSEFTNFKVKIDLSENYLSDESMKEIYVFCLIITDNLVSLNISNNKFTDKSFSYLQEILNICPYIKINILFNNISTRKFRESFKNSLMKFKI